MALVLDIEWLIWTYIAPVKKVSRVIATLLDGFAAISYPLLSRDQSGLRAFKRPRVKLTFAIWMSD